jgi:hypothetical protein
MCAASFSDFLDLLPAFYSEEHAQPHSTCGHVWSEATSDPCVAGWFSRRKFQVPTYLEYFTCRRSKPGLPSQAKAVLVAPFPEESEPVIAWMNIDGQDIQLKQVSLKVSGDKSVAEYRSKDALVTVNYKIFPEQETEAGGRQETSESIAINYKGQLKTINTTGECT